MEWAARLPATVSQLSEQWRLRFEAPFDECHVSLTAPVTRADGTAAVCKIPMPEMEFRFAAGAARHGEAEALRWWNGDGSIRLVDTDEETGAMLIERCVPGTNLAHDVVPESADKVAADLLRRLHVQPPPDATILRLTAMTANMAALCEQRYDAAGQPFERELLDEALEVLRDDAPTPEVLLHGDCHHANILAAQREPWLAIDPLPMIGDPAYDAVQYLLFRKGDLPDPSREWRPAVRHFCECAGLDDSRVLGWIFARLIGDTLANVSGGMPVAKLEAYQDDLWSARLAHRLREMSSAW